MNSNESLFEDIEQDNNPSFYGNRSILNDPYGNLNNNNNTNTSYHNHNNGKNEYDELHNNIVNSTIGLSNRIQEFVNDPGLKIDIVSCERLVNTSVITYSIELSVADSEPIIVKRRYSEFESLRDNLARLFPSVVLPPIPAKHSIITYLVNSINNSNEVTMIESRKRYFKQFLQDLIGIERIKHCPLLYKFLDPNYEMHWNNALNEPPINSIPNNLLLANPIDPSDRNGLYSLLPVVNGFEFNSGTDSASSLKKLNDDVRRLNDQIRSFDHESQFSFEIPQHLVFSEKLFNKNIKILNDLNKLNSRTSKNLKSIINTLIELGGNLNNFSLQIYDNQSTELSTTIEKLGSTVDSNFLNFEGFLLENFVPEWQEPVFQIVQYYLSALQLIKFYKFKIIQFKLVHKLKFNKINELSNFNATFDSQVKLDNLRDLETSSPTISKALKKIELRQKKGRGLKKKGSWYGLFGGSKQLQFSLNDSNMSEGMDINSQFKHKISHIEKELDKLDQLVELSNNDIVKLSDELHVNFHEFLKKLEVKWLIMMLDFIRNGKALFEKNLHNWDDFKNYLVDDSH